MSAFESNVFLKQLRTSIGGRSSSKSPSNVKIIEPSHEGWLGNESKYLQIWRVRWCVIENNMLYIYKKKNTYDIAPPVHSFDLSQYKNIQIDKSQKYLKNKYPFSISFNT